MPAPTLVTGAPCWIDLFSSDTEQAKDFYGQLFGWTTARSRPRVRRLLHLPEGRQGRRRLHGQQRRAGLPRLWTIYLNTDDADRTAADAAAKGGQVHVEPMDVTQNGRFTMISDPGGAAIGAWQPREREGLRGPGRAGHRRLVRAAHAATTTRRSPSTATSSAGRRTPSPTGRLPLHDAGRGRGRARGDHGRLAVPARGHAPLGLVVYFEVEDVDATLEQVDGARREGRAGGRGHAVRPARRCERPHRHALQADQN